jgi:hypothetical protein
MAYLQEIAFKILNGEVGGTFEDKIEAFQFVNDNFLIDKLSPAQQQDYNSLVEMGVIETAPWRNWEN